jgi:hypothetical protein
VEAVISFVFRDCGAEWVRTERQSAWYLFGVLYRNRAARHFDGDGLLKKERREVPSPAFLPAAPSPVVQGMKASSLQGSGAVSLR